MAQGAALLANPTGLSPAALSFIAGFGVESVFLALVGLTAAELAISTAGVERAIRITALAGLLMAKAVAVLTFFMRAVASRRTARLALIAIVTAVVFAVVLMLEAAFRARIR